MEKYIFCMLGNEISMTLKGTEEALQETCNILENSGFTLKEVSKFEFEQEKIRYEQEMNNYTDEE